MHFPLPFIPSKSYKGGNGFGADRSKVREGLVHAANDLAAYPGTPVLAMDSGVVLSVPHPFYSGTFVMEIQHPKFIARYGEIAANAEVAVGDQVLEGQVIAYVGDQPGEDMLHLEFFSGKKSGSFSTAPGTHPPYDRRDDVFNGVKYLDESRGTATHLEGDYEWHYVTDAKGRKFLGPMDLRDI